MNKVKYIIPLLALVLLIPPDLVNAQIPEELENNTKTYTIDEIEHSLGIMDQYIIYDQNKNITFDIINATNNHNVTQSDIEIALDFAVHNNAIMDIAIGPTGQVDETQTQDNEQLKQVLDELENGKFRALFGGESGPVGSVNDIIFTTYVPTYAPIISAFGISEYSIEFISHNSGTSTPTPSYLMACGPYGPSNQHPEPLVIKTGWYSTSSYAIDAISDDYHRVPLWYSGNYGLDFAKETNAYGCNDGEFRSQIVVTDTNPWWKHYSQSPEPNPELLAYEWPASWWGAYVLSWHIVN